VERLVRDDCDQHKILVVDDDSEVLEITAELVRSLGYRTVTASNAFEALDLLRKDDDIEAMLSDVRMPGMDGEKLALAAQTIRPDLQIVLTSGANWPRRNFVFLAKPYRVRDLEQALQHGLIRA
jgi:CheY-like chemotaxis protein